MSLAQRPLDILGVGSDEIVKMDNRQLLEASQTILEMQQTFRKENQIMFYEPVSEAAAEAHQSTARIVAMFGGNGSSKTELCIAEIVMLATGMFPKRYKNDPVMRSKFKGPIQVRIVVESLLNTLWPIILPKFQWFKWVGISEPGGDMGHWGWVPKCALKNGKWESAFSKELRMLTVFCRDPDTNKILGESTISFMSKDNDPEDFASGDFDIVMEDEYPKISIHTENEARTMRKGGRIMLAMTWPDDPTIPVSWIYDEIYEPGAPGPNKDPNIDWFQLDTRDNKHLRQEAVEQQISHWSEEKVGVRIEGKPIQFSHRVHPLFTSVVSWWCFTCNQESHCMLETGGYPFVDGYGLPPNDVVCQKCKGKKVAPFNHVSEEEFFPGYPCVYLIDPHPRKPHMMMWVLVTPQDDFYQIVEAEVDGEEDTVWETVLRIEKEHKLNVVRRLIDPNMGLTPSGKKRQVCWQQLFSDIGLVCDLADDSIEGQMTVNGWLRPDRDTLEPRIKIHPRCAMTIRQMQRFGWANYKVGAEKGVKETAKPVDDDYPSLWKYLANEESGHRLSFSYLKDGPRILKRRRA